jgi:NAD(P)-dependent dehydrogenase (short-subunit alcohol dehydrogenase family)
VLGTILSLKHEMRVMLAQRHGNIVNLSSTFGSRGAAGASMYVASKHAVEGLTKAAALEGAGAGVRVNAVAPGPVETEMLNYGQCRPKNQPGRRRASETRWNGSRDRSGDRVSRL